MSKQPPPGPAAQEQPMLTGSRGKQVMIFLLAVAIAAIFGMQGSLELMGGPANPYQDATEYMRTCESLQGYLNPWGIPRRYGGFEAVLRAPKDRNILQVYQEYLALANLAAEDGLMPAGNNLEDLVDDFLATPAPMQEGTTYLDLLHPAADREARKPPRVSRRELRRFLRVSEAYNALLTRHIRDVAGLPRLAGRYAYHLDRDRLLVDQVTLSTKTLIDRDPKYLAQAQQDTAAIEATYARHKENVFRIDERIVLSLVYASGKELGKSLTIPEEDLQRFYDENRNRWELPPEPKPEPAEKDAAKPDAEAKPEEPPAKRYKPLADVKEEITAELALARGGELAVTLMDRCAKALREQRLIGGDPQDFDKIAAAAAAISITPAEDPRLVKAVSPAIAREVVAELRSEAFRDGDKERRQLSYHLGEAFGTIDDGDLPLLTRTVGWTSGDVYRPNGVEHVLLLLRLDELTPASYQDLAAARERIVRFLAARAAWGDLLAQTRQLAQGFAGGQQLAEHFTQDAVKQHWGAEIQRGRKLPMLVEIGEPNPAVDVYETTRPESLYRLAAATGPGPVALARLQSPPGADPQERRRALDEDRFPAVTMLQVVGIERGPEADDQGLRQGLAYLTMAFQRLLRNEFDIELSRRQRD